MFSLQHKSLHLFHFENSRFVETLLVLCLFNLKSVSLLQIDYFTLTAPYNIYLIIET